ncbi:hypothetical protein B0H19DRAFT_1385069 [Mycena capillaripes]|nr:hypothetical protein B0H19DRAFT_1385069 [Mycena capillaripes]
MGGKQCMTARHEQSEEGKGQSGSSRETRGLVQALSLHNAKQQPANAAMFQRVNLASWRVAGKSCAVRPVLAPADDAETRTEDEDKMGIHPGGRARRTCVVPHDLGRRQFATIPLERAPGISPTQMRPILRRRNTRGIWNDPRRSPEWAWRGTRTQFQDEEARKPKEQDKVNINAPRANNRGLAGLAERYEERKHRGEGLA